MSNESQNHDRTVHDILAELQEVSRTWIEGREAQMAGLTDKLLTALDEQNIALVPVKKLNGMNLTMHVCGGEMPDGRPFNVCVTINGAAAFFEVGEKPADRWSVDTQDFVEGVLRAVGDKEGGRL